MTLLDTPTVSLIVPVHDGGTKFEKCLLSLTACTPPPCEIIVVADGDTDSGDLAEEAGATVLRTPKARGPAHARNLGANIAKGNILFFVDADVTISNDAISKLINAFQNDSEISAILGSYDDDPLETNLLSQYKNLSHHYVHQTSSSDASTFWGACGAIRRDVFLEMGGFNEGYGRPSIEDIELGYRLKIAGHNIRLLKELEVKHLKRWEALSLVKTDFFCRALPWTDLIFNRGRFINDLNLKTSNRISVISVYLLVIALLGAFYASWLLYLAILSTIVIIVLNWDFYRFFVNKRGLYFTIKILPWHWLYFLYSGLAFSIGFARYQGRKLVS